MTSQTGTQRRTLTRHITGEAERRFLQDGAEFRSVLRDDFGLNMSDNEIQTCISVMERKGEKGAPHPFFA
jgi:N-hydroxyarylamine O-acetyltransferase